MNWLLSPVGIGVIIVCIVAIASLIYWKRKPIKKWLESRKVDVTLKAGPVEVGLSEKEKPNKEEPRAGVDFGENSNFTGAVVDTVAGRDIRHGTTTEPPKGKTPGVRFGKKGEFSEAEITNVAGRDVVEE